ncbi:hypothetical protein [Ferruginibacter sp.]|uniref:hypothetical protein n=1 Tax=Ferruginibacter sp. TaxID=1940288 RepID=UPI00374CE0B2
MTANYFFSQKVLEFFLQKHAISFELIIKPAKKDTLFFVIANDEYINRFIASLWAVKKLSPALGQYLMAVKFEEIMLYLAGKYGQPFIQYLYTLIKVENNSIFKKRLKIISALI